MNGLWGNEGFGFMGGDGDWLQGLFVQEKITLTTSSRFARVPGLG